MNFLDAISFHANASLLSLGESIVEVAGGTKKFLVDDGKEFSWKFYNKFRDSTGINGRVSKGLVGLFGYVTHLVGGTMVGAGEAIGNGAGMIAVGIKGNIRNPGETIALGATNVIGGLGAGLAMGVAPAMPKPQIAMQTFNVGMDGAVAVATSSVQVSGIAVPSAAAASITGALAMSGTQQRKQLEENKKLMANLEKEHKEWLKSLTKEERAIYDAREKMDSIESRIDRSKSYADTTVLREELGIVERELVRIKRTAGRASSLKNARMLAAKIDALERYGGNAQSAKRVGAPELLDEFKDSFR